MLLDCLLAMEGLGEGRSENFDRGLIKQVQSLCNNRLHAYPKIPKAPENLPFKPKLNRSTERLAMQRKLRIMSASGSCKDLLSSTSGYLKKDDPLA